jgi:hypothetical protein
VQRTFFNNQAFYQSHAFYERHGDIAIILARLNSLVQRMNSFKRIIMAFNSPSKALLGALLFLSSAAALAQTAATPVCVQDESVKERFISVELLTGNPPDDKQNLSFAPVDRVYPFVSEQPDGSAGSGEVSLRGPMSWTGEGGTVYEIYERKVPSAHERFALTPDRTAIGRVYDERFGNATNEGKFPVGTWAQGQKRSYNTTYFTGRGSVRLSSSVEIEKLSCVFEGVGGALQYGCSSVPTFSRRNLVS